MGGRMKHRDLVDAECSIAQALNVVGDWWTLLVVRDIAGGLTRFEQLQRELGVSRKILTERLNRLVDSGVILRRPYSEHPPRFDYTLTEAGLGLLPVLIALQDWGSRFVLGDGTLTATNASASAEAKRMKSLVGKRVPTMTLVAQDGTALDPISGNEWTVIYCFPGAFPPGGQAYPPGWSDIPGAGGCTLESMTYRDRASDFLAIGAAIRGVSTQRPDQLEGFAKYAQLPFTLLSDAESVLAAALRLPTFRAAGVDRLKRATLIVDGDRTIRAVQYPVTDPAASVAEALNTMQELTSAYSPRR
jgi:DNA-binding HxlR family transcriptional regulator/peroxiredoxin